MFIFNNKPQICGFLISFKANLVWCPWIVIWFYEVRPATCQLFTSFLCRYTCWALGPFGCPSYLHMADLLLDWYYHPHVSIYMLYDLVFPDKNILWAMLRGSCGSSELTSSFTVIYIFFFSPAIQHILIITVTLCFSIHRHDINQLFFISARMKALSSVGLRYCVTRTLSTGKLW